MPKITPTLWYDGAAEEAANFYVTLLPNSHLPAQGGDPGVVSDPNLLPRAG